MVAPVRTPEGDVVNSPEDLLLTLCAAHLKLFDQVLDANDLFGRGRARTGSSQFLFGGLHTPLMGGNDSLRCERRCCGDQTLRVGVLGILQNIQRRTGLNNPPSVHDDQLLSTLSSKAEVVGDEQNRCSHLGGHGCQVVQDTPDRHVQRRGRLISDEQLLGVRQGRWQ